MATRMQQRRGTAAQWTAANPILAAGEIGFETDTSKFKMGNGSSAWSALTYFANAAELTALLDGAPEALNTLNELAAAIGDDANFVGTVTAHTSATTNVHGIANTAALATTAGVNSAIDLAKSEVSAAVVAVANDLTAHNSDTLNVHGIVNTADIVLRSEIANFVTGTELTDAIDSSTDGYPNLAGPGLQWNAADEEFAVDTAVIANLSYVNTAKQEAIDAALEGATEKANEAAQAAADALAAHQSDTTGIHGIEDTALLATKAYADAAEADAILAAASAADTKVSDHNAETENVHGIADTAELATKSYADAIGTTATDALALKAPLSSPTFTGTVVLPTVTAGGSIVPTTDNTFDLGSPTNMWKDIYVGPGSLYVNGQKVLQDESGAIVVSADINENLGLRTSGSGNIELDPTGTGSVNIKGPLVVEAGAAFSSNDGNGIAFSNGIKSNSLESNSLNTDLSLSGNGTGKVYLNDNAEVNGNLVVGGNLTVSGTTTTVNSETISLADNIIDLNSNFTTGSPTENAGLRIMRGDSSAVQIRWNESTDKWEFTTDGTNYSVIAGLDSPTFTGTVTIPAGASISGYAPTANPTFTGTVTVAANGVAFTDGTQTKAGVPSVSTIATTLAAGARTIAPGEQDKFIPLAGAVVITLPATGYSTGQSIDFYQESGTGARFESTNGVVATPGRNFRATYSVATALKTASGWLVFGDLSA